MTIPVQLLRSVPVAQGTTAFHFSKPAGFGFKPGQACDLILPGQAQNNGADTRRAANAARNDDVADGFGGLCRDGRFPHGVGRAKENIKKSGMSVLQFPQGVKFGDDTAYLIIGIAGVGNEHLSILANITTALDTGEDDEIVEHLRTTKDIDEIYTLFVEQEHE